MTVVLFENKWYECSTRRIIHLFFPTNKSASFTHLTNTLESIFKL